jgi:hypothetical protein
MFNEDFYLPLYLPLCCWLTKRFAVLLLLVKTIRIQPFAFCVCEKKNMALVLKMRFAAFADDPKSGHI